MFPLFKRFLVAIVATGIGLVCCASTMAHGKNESYIWLNAQADHVDGKVVFRLDDLRNYFGFEISEDFNQALPDVLAHEKEMQEYIRKHFGITHEGAEIDVRFVKTDLYENEWYGHFAQFHFRTDTMEVPDQLMVRNSLLFEFDAFQRSLLCMEYNDKLKESYPESFFHLVFSKWNTEQEFNFLDVDRVNGHFLYFIWQGMLHIWGGLDHVLFLLTLLLASVLVKKKVQLDKTTSDSPADSDISKTAESFKDDELAKMDLEMATEESRWVPVAGFTGALWNVVKIVTIFTIAHSVTLALATLGIVNLPSQLVESIIALSIILVAVNNIIPTFRDRTWIVLFLFGLFHGLGFASVMQHLPFRMRDLTKVLVCFNVGVELGQIVIVAFIFPFLYSIRNWRYFKPVVLVGGSVVLALIAAYWFVERAFGFG